MMPCRQQSLYTASHSTVSPGVERSPVFFSFSQFGPRNPYQQAIIHQPTDCGRNIDTFKSRSSYITVPISPQDSDPSFCTNSPTSPTSVSSSNQKFYSPASSIGQLQSSLIMPSLFTIFKQGSQSGSRNKREQYWDKKTSCKSLASLTNETIEFQHPVIRKCNTSVSLSSSAAPVHTVIKNKNKKNFSSKITSPTSFEEIYRRGTSGNKRSVSLWTKVDNMVEPMPQKASISCSRCHSTNSLNISQKEFLVMNDSLHCKLCLGDFAIEDMYQIQQCQCRFCIYCMRMYLMIKIQDGESHIQCPDSNCDCQGEFTLEDIKSLLSEQYIQLFLKFTGEAEIDMDPSRVWCPAPGCETVVQLSGSASSGREKPASCPTCQLNFCATCSSRWVGTHSCKTYGKKLKDCIKRCPRCEIPIERDAGCAQMQCKKCKHVFCWYCLTSLEDDFLLRHYDKGSCKNKLGHSRASVLWHRAQVITIFTTVGLIMIAGFPLLLFLGPCLLCRRCCMNCVSTERTEYYYNV